MEIISVILCIWGACGAWKWLTAKNNEWLNTKEPLNIVVKVALCVALGWLFVAWQAAKFALEMCKHLF